MPSETTTLLEEAGAALADAVALRRRIHRRPELGLDLPETQATVLESLDGFDVQVRTGSGCSSVVADLVGGAGPGPTVLLRGDMDALPMREDADVEFRSERPDAMHACGHDAHTAMLVGAARVLHARREELAGTVRFMFQPGEEGYHGARVMIEEGVLDAPPVDAAFAMHVTPNIPTGMVSYRAGPIMASVDDFRIVVTGRGGHGSTPHLANDPVPVACEMVQAFQTLVTRRVDAFDPAVLTVGKLRAGTTENVIPETAELIGTIRTVSRRTRALVREGIERVATNVAAAHEMRADVELHEGYPVTVNDATTTDHVARVAGGLIGEDRVFELPSPVMGAEDFSYILERVPGSMALLGVCPPGHGPMDAPSCHSNRMTIDEDAMATGIALHVAMALDLLDVHRGAG